MLKQLWLLLFPIIPKGRNQEPEVRSPSKFQIPRSGNARQFVSTAHGLLCFGLVWFVLVLLFVFKTKSSTAFSVKVGILCEDRTL